jgi:hypothetical protein
MPALALRSRFPTKTQNNNTAHTRNERQKDEPPKQTNTPERAPLPRNEYVN